MINVMCMFAKVWDILSGNCLWTFRQQNPITAVQLGEDICVNGSEDSKVYVWDIKTGNAIKVYIHINFESNY